MLGCVIGRNPKQQYYQIIIPLCYLSVTVMPVFSSNNEPPLHHKKTKPHSGLGVGGGGASKFNTEPRNLAECNLLLRL